MFQAFARAGSATVVAGREQSSSEQPVRAPKLQARRTRATADQRSSRGSIRAAGSLQQTARERRVCGSTGGCWWWQEGQK